MYNDLLFSSVYITYTIELAIANCLHFTQIKRMSATKVGIKALIIDSDPVSIGSYVGNKSIVMPPVSLHMLLTRGCLSAYAHQSTRSILYEDRNESTQIVIFGQSLTVHDIMDFIECNTLNDIRRVLSTNQGCVYLIPGHSSLRGITFIVRDLASEASVASVVVNNNKIE